MSEKKTEVLGWIYIIQQVGTNHYKIGYTKEEPTRRLKELKTGSPNGIKLIGKFRGTMNDEATLHDACSRCARHGEWFEFDTGRFFTVIVKLALGSDLMPKRKLHAQTVKEFVRDNYLVGKNPPSTKYDGVALSELFERFKDYCYRVDYDVPNYKNFRSDLYALPIGHAKFGSDVYFRMQLDEHSELVVPDY